MSSNEPRPESAAQLVERVRMAQARVDAMKLERQELGVPILRDRLHRREILAADVVDAEREIAALLDAVPLMQAQEEQTRREAERLERQRLTDDLRSEFETLARERDAMVIVLSEKPVPTVDELRDLRQRGRVCEDFRTVLLAATHEGQFTKSVDPVDRLERCQRDQHSQRDRNFTLLWGPGAPRPPLPRHDRLARLRALLSAEAGVRP